MAYTSPPGRVVYEEEPASAKALLASPDYAAAEFNEQFAGYRPWSWQEFRFIATDADGLVFSHERTAPAGTRRLVIVEVAVAPPVPPQAGPLRQELRLLNYVIRPGSFGEVPEVANNQAFGWTVQKFSALAPADRVRLFAGQPDAADPTHFTIGYAVNGVPGTIDGWLGDDERVKLQVRKGQGGSR